jgi:hypothetical protein
VLPRELSLDGLISNFFIENAFFVTKTISGDELVDAVVRVGEGDAVFSPRLAGFVLGAFRAGVTQPAPLGSATFCGHT